MAVLRYLSTPQLEPMLARAGRKIFDDQDWSFELKYDGFRALLYLDRGAVRFMSRHGSDFTRRFPELAQVVDALKRRPLILDGEIIAGDGSVASFRELRYRYAKSSITALKPKEKVPIKYVVFDVLLLDGRSLVNEPLNTRHARLRELIPKSAKGLLRAKIVVGHGSELLDEAESSGFEGIVAKRLDSIYEPGKRSKNWLKFKTKAAADDMPLRGDLFKK